MGPKSGVLSHTRSLKGSLEVTLGRNKYYLGSHAGVITFCTNAWCCQCALTRQRGYVFIREESLGKLVRISVLFIGPSNQPF